jgi:GT2 family glycosyltransferase
METTKDLSVIIVNYKSEHFLDRCLSSFFNSASGLSSEVIIVNNYPPETLEKVKQNFPQIKVIVNPQNSGFGGGNNLGTKEARGEYILFLNPDTEIISGTVSDAVTRLRKNPELGAIGGCLITEEREIQEWSAGTKVTFWEILKNNLGILSSRKIWKSSKEVEVAWVAGTALFMSKKLFLTLGGFDEKIFMYFEDVDLCERIRKIGEKIIYYPDFKVLHKCGGSWTEEGRKKQKQKYYDSQNYYFQKHRPKIEYLAINILRKLFFS